MNNRIYKIASSWPNSGDDERLQHGLNTMANYVKSPAKDFKKMTLAGGSLSSKGTADTFVGLCRIVGTSGAVQMVFRCCCD